MSELHGPAHRGGHCGPVQMVTEAEHRELLALRIAAVAYVRADCTAEPQHVATYFEHDPDGWYPPPCMYCAYSDLAEAHRGCEHSHHKAWRRWKITGWLAGQLYATGITSNGGSWRLGGGCDGCRTMPRWNRNRRVYVLWKRTDHWRCLLKYRHAPGDPIGFGMCAKCLPCPDCGSKTAGHNTGCDLGDPQ